MRIFVFTRLTVYSTCFPVSFFILPFTIISNHSFYIVCLVLNKLCEGLYFAYDPSTAETLHMRDEGETSGFLPQNARVSTWLRMLGKQATINTYL